MGRFIVKLPTSKGDRYLEWSTVVDAPATYGMPLEGFKDYYRSQYGNRGMEQLATELANVKKFGTSRNGYTLEDLAGYNRAGKDETRLTIEQIVDYYCDRLGEGEWPIGVSWQDEG